MSITCIALPPFSQGKSSPVYCSANITMVPLLWGLHAHPSYRRLQLGLKGAVAGEALADIVQQCGGFLGFAEESQQLSTCRQEQSGFVVAPTVLVAHDGVDPP